MTEQEWLECAEPEKMLAYIGAKASDRKLRLFAVACCRRIWHLITAEQARRAVALSEQYADQEVSLYELSLAASNAMLHVDKCYRADRPDGGAYAAYSTASPYERDDLGNFGDTACCGAFNTDAGVYASRNAVQADSGNVYGADRSAQADLLREIIGNPFQQMLFDRAWLTWHDSTIPKIAQGIYEERSFANLPILADALEEAGCTNADILNHCRTEGSHVRGCWVVDLLLGKQ